MITNRCQCGRAITDDSPSPDHCSDGCARNWAARVYQVPGLWPPPSTRQPEPVRSAAPVTAARDAPVVRGRARSFCDLLRRYGLPIPRGRS